VLGVRSALGGQPTETFEAFARRERAKLVAFAWVLTGSLATAEELAQDALAAAWRDWDRIGGYDRPGAWARRAVANRAVDVHRQMERERRAMRRVAPRDDADDSSRLMIGGENAALLAAVRDLPMRQAQVVTMHYLEDRSVSEIGAILGCTEATVRVHLHRARIGLARHLGLIGEEESDG